MELRGVRRHPGDERLVRGQVLLERRDVQEQVGSGELGAVFDEDRLVVPGRGHRDPERYLRSVDRAGDARESVDRQRAGEHIDTVALYLCGDHGRVRPGHGDLVGVDHVDARGLQAVRHLLGEDARCLTERDAEHGGLPAAQVLRECSPCRRRRAVREVVRPGEHVVVLAPDGFRREADHRYAVLVQVVG